VPFRVILIMKHEVQACDTQCVEVINKWINEWNNHVLHATQNRIIILQVLTAVTVKNTVVWDVMTNILAGSLSVFCRNVLSLSSGSEQWARIRQQVDWNRAEQKSSYCLLFAGCMLFDPEDRVIFSIETSVDFCWTVWHHGPEHSKIRDCYSYARDAILKATKS
jgi:hypothetical protein